MTSVFVLMAVIAVSYVMVVAAATVLEITGLGRDAARFQALSAFSGTGFTTRQAELVVRHPIRRRVVTTLMVLGNAGTAGLVASLMGSFTNQLTTWSLARNAVLLVLFSGASVLIVRQFGNAFGDRLRRLLSRRVSGDAVPSEELLTYKPGWGIVRVHLPRGSAIAGLKLRDSQLRERQLQVLAVEAGPDVHPIPDPEWTFQPGQNVIVYGDLRVVQETFAPPEEAA